MISHIKHLRLLLLFEMMTVLFVTTEGQNNAEYYYQLKKPWHKLYFHADGTFKEIEVNWLNYCVCQKGVNISKGTYRKASCHFILDSDNDWILPDTCYLDNVDTAVKESDSLEIVFNSYYEQMFKEETENNICTYPHHRIYLYSISLKCGEDSLNKSFEKAFNAKHCADSVGKISEYCPREIEIHSIEMKMYWKDKDSKFPHNSLSQFFLYVPKDYRQRFFLIKLPWQVDYFLLCRIAHRNQKVRKITSSTIVLSGIKFKRIKFKRLPDYHRRERLDSEMQK